MTGDALAEVEMAMLVGVELDSGVAEMPPSLTHRPWLEAGCLSRSVPANLCNTVVAVVLSVERQSEEHFRTINVQWNGQWSLFGRCGNS